MEDQVTICAMNHEALEAATWITPVLCAPGEPFAFRGGGTVWVRLVGACDYHFDGWWDGITDAEYAAMRGLVQHLDPGCLVCHPDKHRPEAVALWRDYHRAVLPEVGGRERPPCLVCGEPQRQGEPCWCLAPTMVVALTITVKAPTYEALPTPDGVRLSIEEGLHGDFFTPEIGDDWFIEEIGYPANTERAEWFNCPTPEED